ncbi:MAG: STAS domain-containing protein, partial [Firmicutes bacterium]|nr:STAS domain-containing protein [Bacillota bacterium]
EVDCRNLTMIDSAGLGCLVMFQKKLQERQGQLRMTRVRHKYLLHLLDMLELDRVIEITQ